MYFGDTDMRKMKEGDIFFWVWRNPDIRSYHCKSQKAVVQNGRLKDTFWFGSEGALNLKDIKTRYQGNMHEMTAILPSTIPYHKPGDIVDMRHANLSDAPVYLKAGAKRDQGAMRAHAKYLIDRSESDIRMAEDRIKRFKEALIVIEVGELDEVYL